MLTEPPAGQAAVRLQRSQRRRVGERRSQVVQQLSVRGGIPAQLREGVLPCARVERSFRGSDALQAQSLPEVEGVLGNKEQVQGLTQPALFHRVSENAGPLRGLDRSIERAEDTRGVAAQ